MRRLQPYCWLFLAITSTGAAADTDCPGEPATPARQPVTHAHEVLLPVPAGSAGVLIEEYGSDLSYRLPSDAAPTDISIKPPRLGIAAVRATSGPIAVRVHPSQAAGVVVLRQRCIGEAELAFFANLQTLYVERINAGAEAAGSAIPELERQIAATTDTLHLAWLRHTLANALLSAGKHEASADAFLRARRAWLDASEPGRAAIALLAAGEDASRAGQYDDATGLITEARAEFEAHGLPYYALRASAALCLVKSRRGELLDSVACEEAVADRFHALGERSEAGARGISIANQWLKLGNLDKARARLLRVDENAAALTPVARAKLNAAFGNLHLQTGDVETAAQELAVASERLGALGLPRDQAIIDIQLARLARLAGAYTEEARLLDRAAAQLDPENSPETVASVSIFAALSRVAVGRASEAPPLLERAAILCERIGKQDCIERVALARVQADLGLGNASAARRGFASLTPSVLESSLAGKVSLESRLLLLERQPAAALQLLERSPIPVLGSDADVELALVRAGALVQMGETAKARAGLQTQLDAMVHRIGNWPSTALRASARHRIARLQAAIFDLLEWPASGTLDASTLAVLQRTIEAGHPQRMAAAADAALRLPDDVRKALSRAVESGQESDQRALFLALSVTTTSAEDPAIIPETAPRPWPGTDAGTLQLLPVAGAERFVLIAASGDSARHCLDMPRTGYDDLTRRFDQALDGQPADLGALDREALRWFDAISACTADAGGRWHVVATPGTRMLPWAWIAASAEHRERTEPDLAIRFGLARHAAGGIAAPVSATVMNLNLADGDALPFAANEEARVRAVLVGKGVRTPSFEARTISAESLLAAMAPARQWVHVIGHANPPRHGGLYTGLWIPAADAPVLVTYPEIASSTLSTDLIVLSACGDNAFADTPAGSRLRIAEAFVSAGAKQVIAASNTASDSAAAYWTALLFEELLRTGDVAAATRAARHALRHSPHFRHPRFWAGIDNFASDGTPRSSSASGW